MTLTKNFLVLMICFSAAILAYPNSTYAQARLPAIEHSSLLDAFTVKFQGAHGLGRTGGRMVLNHKHEMMGVFFPENARLNVELVKAGNDQPIYSEACRLTQSGGNAFTRIEAVGAEGYLFQDEGDYELRFRLNEKVISVMPFQVFFKKKGDDFDSKTYTFVDGDWSKLSYMSYSADDQVSPLKFNTWTRKIAFTTTPEPSKINVTLLQGDEVVAVTPQGTVAWPEWQPRETTFTFPQNKGGKVFQNIDLMKRSGKHSVRVDLDGKPHQFFNFTVKDGKILGHPRQAMDYSERERWLCPRKIRLGLEDTSHVVWLQRSNAAESDDTAKVAAPSRETKSNWVPRSSVDANQPFQLTHTNIRMRKDMPVSVGEGIVAYATGSQGVGYFVVGEDKPKSIKDGQSFRGDLFFACGKLIMLAKRNTVTVFSTEVERSVEIPADEIFLSYQKHSLYGPRLLDADGYLIATVNEPANLKEKNVIKVIDVSGDNRPAIIPIRNSDFELRDVTSIKVNAEAGIVAVGSKRKGAIYVADIAVNSPFRKYDISGYDSFGEADMVLTESKVLYVDAAGFANVRMLDLETGEVTMPAMSQYGGGWGPVGASNGSTFAWTIKEPRNAWAIGDHDAVPPNNTDSKGQFNNAGRLGAGRSMAMANDGTVFIAGTKSISTASCLQATQKDQWKFVLDPNTGNPVPAIDVVGGNSMVVFKTGKPSTSSEVTLSYATFGSEVRLPSPGNNVVDETTAANAKKDEANEMLLNQGSANSAAEVLSEIDRAFLDSIIENEETIFNALKNSLSESDARKRAREAGVNALNSAGRDHLIEVYKKSWK